MDEEELIERDSERDIWQEALNAVRDIKAENVGHVEAVELPPMVEARRKSGLSQPQFAESYPLHVNISP